MDKIRSLLLPIALVFAAIAVFEFGARYGATNMRAHAIASELQFPLRIYEQAGSNMDDGSRATFTMLIDNGIAAGAMHRQIWYLDGKASAALDQVLAYALSLRGDAVVERFASLEAGDAIPGLNKGKLKQIQEAVNEAKVDLIDNAPSVGEKEAAQK